MAILSKGTTFSTGNQVTAINLNALVDSATFAAGAVDNTTTALDSNVPARITIANGGVGTTQLADSSSKTTGVTFAKMQHISTAKVLGRISASEGDVEEAFDFKDEDDMSSNSATALSSQQSIKAYIDKLKPNIVQTVKTDTETIASTATTTPLSVTITPRFPNSHFRVSFSVSSSSEDTAQGLMFTLKRGVSVLVPAPQGDQTGFQKSVTLAAPYAGSGAGITVSSFSCIDTLSFGNLSPIQYNLQAFMIPGGNNGYINRSVTDSATSSFARAASSMMVEEIYQ